MVKQKKKIGCLFNSVDSSGKNSWEKWTTSNISKRIELWHCRKAEGTEVSEFKKVA